MSTALALLAALLYAAAAVSLAREVRAEGPGRSRVATAMSLAAMAIHAVLLARAVFHDDGLHLGVGNAASLFALISAAALHLAMLRLPVRSLGIFVLPLAALALVAGSLWPVERALTTDLSAGTQAHLVVSVLAYSVLTLAVCQALVLAYQTRQLSGRHPSAVIRVLPPLQTQDALLFQLITVGFAFLGLSLVTGVVFVNDLFAQHLVHKTVLSFLSFGIFGWLLWGRWRHGLRGRSALRRLLGGFGVLALAYFGSKWVLEGVLGRAWFAG